MKRKYIQMLAVALALVVSVCSWEACKKIHIGCGGPMVGNEPTTVALVFTNANNPSDVQTATCTIGNWHDASKAHLTLSASTGYHVQVMFYNVGYTQSSSSYNVTPSVKNEGSSYLICFTDSTNMFGNLASNLHWTRQDLDNGKNPLPLGLIDSFWTGSDSTCALMATTLHHQYKVKNGDCDPGYIDIQVVDTIYISPNKG